MARTAIHPGEHLAEAIEASGIAAAQLAREIEVPPNGVTANMWLCTTMKEDGYYGGSS